MRDDISNPMIPPSAVPMREPAVAASALEAARERTIRVLTDRFADDTLSLDEFEARLDRMYRATRPEELDTLLREVESRHIRPVSLDAGASYAPSTPRRIFAFMSSTKRNGRFALPRKLETRAVMSEVVLDLRDVTLTAGVSEIDMFILMSNVEILVAPGVIVEEMPLSVMSSVENAAVDDGTIPMNAPRIRLIGTAFMSNVEVRVAPTGLSTKKAWRQAKWGRRLEWLRGQ